MSLILALLLDGAFGEPRWIWSRVAHPAVVMGRVVGWLERHLNSGALRRAKGVFAIALLLAGAVLLGLALARLGPIAETLCIAVLLAHRSLTQHVGAVAGALRHSVTEGRLCVSKIVSRDCTGLSIAEVSRAAIESAAENLSDAVIAPVFWFGVAGLPGLLAYKVINTADSMIGYRNQRYAEFGWGAARLDDLANLIPARLTGLMIAALSGQLRAWPAIMSDARRHRSPNAGWPEAAMARALGIALAGPRSYDGQKQALAWVNGSARRDIGPQAIKATIVMLWKIWGLVLLLAVAFSLVRALN